MSSKSGIPAMSSMMRPPTGQHQASASFAPPQQSAANGQKSIIEIYTDWANHYLDKLGKSKSKKIKNLQTELQDGLLLADVVEAVVGTKVPDIVKKPKTAAQQIGNQLATKQNLISWTIGNQILGPIWQISCGENCLALKPPMQWFYYC